MEKKEMNNKLAEANLLQSEIRDIEYFINALDVSGLWREKSNVTSIIKRSVETKTTYSILGRRFFGCGALEETINVPTSMMPSLVIQAKELLKSKQVELSNIIS